VSDLHNSRRVEEAHLPAMWSGIVGDSHKILKCMITKGQNSEY